MKFSTYLIAGSFTLSISLAIFLLALAFTLGDIVIASIACLVILAFSWLFLSRQESKRKAIGYGLFAFGLELFSFPVIFALKVSPAIQAMGEGAFENALLGFGQVVLLGASFTVGLIGLALFLLGLIFLKLSPK